jgi:hypothetical protein
MKMKVNSPAVATEELNEWGKFQPEAFLAMLRSFDDSDQQEQERAFAELIKALDEDRPERRKLFPEQ